MQLVKNETLKLCKNAWYYIKNLAGEGSFKPSYYNTVFKTEIVGITKGPKWASALTIKSINIVVDSQAASLNALGYVRKK